MGSDISALGDLIGGFSQAGEANAQSQIARNNAIIATQNAQHASQVGEVEAEQQGMKNRAQLGAIKATQAANGVDVNTGSAADVQESARRIGMLDTMTLRSNAARAAYGYEQEAATDTLQSQLYRKQAKAAPWMGALKAGGSLLSGAASSSQSGGGGGGKGGGLGGDVSDFGEALWAAG